MSVHQIKVLLLLTLLTITLSACSDGSPAAPEEVETYAYSMPISKNDGWQTGHLVDHNFDEQAITDLINGMLDGTHPGIDSISIVRNNTLLLHEDIRTELTQFDDWVGNDDLQRHVMHSTSKSFVSALVGVALEQGYIQDIDTPFYEFFDYGEYENWDVRKSSMTLENVLTMQLGLDWNEWNYPFGDMRNSLTNLTENNDDFVKALLDLPLTSDPGTEYAYNTVASIALGLVVELATNQPMEDFAEQYLFTPLQISDADWLMTPTGFPNTGSGLFLPTRDMAKFGQLYLNDGEWNGIPVISSDWVQRSVAKSVELQWDYTSGYGYQWWLGNFQTNNQVVPFYSTRGFGGQFIVVVPDYDMVIAFTAHNYENDLYDSPFRLIEQFILPAVLD